MSKSKEETKVIEKKSRAKVAVEAMKPKGKIVDGKLYIKRRNFNQGQAGTDVVTVECPFCPDEHQHRISSSLKGSLGDKTSHCVPGQRYSLHESEEQSISAHKNVENNKAIKKESETI